MKLAVRTNDWEIHTRNDLTTKEGLEQLEQALQIGVILISGIKQLLDELESKKGDGD